MSRTTRCLFALGLSVSLVAACGDDDTIAPGGGGTGGRAGSGGTGGAAGAAGASGAAGSAGEAGSGGSGTGGSGGSAGTGGSGGSGATGGSSQEPPDGGVDGGDGGVEGPTDAGPEPIECPDLDEATADAETSTNSQEVIITRLVFEGTNIVVTFRAVADTFDFGNSVLQLCTGSQLNGDCDAGVQNITGSGGGDGGTALVEGEEVEFTTPLGDIVTAASGEIALVNGHPAVDADPIIRAYINWGNYVSLPASVGPNAGETLEAAAQDDNVWVVGDSVEVNGQTTIYATGDVTDENGFEVCTQTP